MGTLGKWFVLMAAVFPAGLSAAERQPQAKYFGDAMRGQEIAARWCTGCHRVSGSPLDDQIPSFAGLAASGRSEEAIRGFLLQPHRPMPPLTLSNQQIEDLIAYLRSLAPGR